MQQHIAKPVNSTLATQTMPCLLNDKALLNQNSCGRGINLQVQKGTLFAQAVYRFHHNQDQGS